MRAWWPLIVLIPISFVVGIVWGECEMAIFRRKQRNKERVL